MVNRTLGCISIFSLAVHSVAVRYLIEIIVRHFFEPVATWRCTPDLSSDRNGRWSSLVIAQWTIAGEERGK